MDNAALADNLNNTKISDSEIFIDHWSCLLQWQDVLEDDPSAIWTTHSNVVVVVTPMNQSPQQQQQQQQQQQRTPRSAAIEQPKTRACHIFQIQTPVLPSVVRCRFQAFVQNYYSKLQSWNPSLYTGSTWISHISQSKVIHPPNNTFTWCAAIWKIQDRSLENPRSESAS